MLPKNRKPTHPGEMLLEEFLKPLNLTQQSFAKHMGWTYAKVNEIVNGKRGVSPEVALSLADAFSNTPQFWMNLQSQHDLWVALQEHKEKKKVS
ncbi:MAG: HigA family addiction module antitoxin [Bdellovibrionales bacterium]|nr:HigA family addiction module antitoxin [Bdellovibrionales bacterium]